MLMRETATITRKETSRRDGQTSIVYTLLKFNDISSHVRELKVGKMRGFTYLSAEDVKC